MTDDKRPLEFWLYDNGEIPFLAFYTEEELTEETNNRQIDKYHVIEKSAYDSLAERLKVAEAERLHFWKICVERADQVDTLNTELLNTNELSSKLVEENAALKVEVERLRVQLAGCGVAALQNTEESRAVRVEPHAYGWSQSYQDVCNAVDREIELRDQLAREREISAMLRDAMWPLLREYRESLWLKARDLPDEIAKAIRSSAVADNAEQALAREKEMRK